MAEFKHWVSYFYAYNGDIKGKNVGFVKMDVREGKCRLYICLKGVYGFEREGLAVNLFVRRNGRPEKLPIGRMDLREGNGEFTASTNAENLFGTGERLLTTGGVWLCGGEKDTIYLTSWEKSCLNIHDFLPQSRMEKPVQGSEKNSAVPDSGSFRKDRQTVGRETAKEEEQATEVREESTQLSGSSSGQDGEKNGRMEKENEGADRLKAQEAEASGEEEAAAAIERRLPASLWENLCRYYPKTAPELAADGIELLQIRPADIRYLPRRLWHLGSNSFLLHGYYRYKHLILGRMAKNDTYFLGVRGSQEEREKFSARLFGFYQFLPINRNGVAGYWYMPITMDNEEGENISEEEGTEPEEERYT